MKLSNIFDCVFLYIVKLVYNNHPRDPKFGAIVDRCSLFRGWFKIERLKFGLQNDDHCIQWSLFGGGR